MENLNLSSYGVEELSEFQMEHTEGGGAGALILGCIILVAICYYCGDHSAR